MARTTSPNVKATPAWVMAPLVVSLIMMAPVPANTRANVPSASATYFFIEDDLTLCRGESKEEAASRVRCPRLGLDETGVGDGVEGGSAERGLLTGVIRNCTPKRKCLGFQNERGSDRIRPRETFAG